MPLSAVPGHLGPRTAEHPLTAIDATVYGAVALTVQMLVVVALLVVWWAGR